MRKPKNQHRISFPRSTQALIWSGSVIIGALLGLWLQIETGPFSLLTYIAYLGIPFLGSDFLVYGNFHFWRRPRDGRRDTRSGLTFVGYVAAIGVCTALRMYWLNLDLNLKLVQ